MLLISSAKAKRSEVVAKMARAMDQADVCKMLADGYDFFHTRHCREDNRVLFVIHYKSQIEEYMHV